jgi:hypothetical protein
MELGYSHHVEPEGSLQFSQEPSTVPILNQINPVHTITVQFRYLGIWVIRIVEEIKLLMLPSVDYVTTGYCWSGLST